MQFWSGTPFLDTVDVLALVPILDEAGFDGVITADHLIYPRHLTSPYPDGSDRPPWQPQTPWPDSWVMIGAMAAITTRLRFTNAVYVAPSRPLLEVAKQVATAAVISQGRVALTVGAGWMREEFELLGQYFNTRGKRLNEMIPALRALWQGGWVSWDGEHYQVPELMLEPHPPAPVPIIAAASPSRPAQGGATLRRLGRLCIHLGRRGFLRAEAQRNSGVNTEGDSEPFDIMLALLEPPTPDLRQARRGHRHHRGDVLSVGRDAVARRRCRALPGTHRAVRREHHRKGAVIMSMECRRGQGSGAVPVPRRSTVRIGRLSRRWCRRGWSSKSAAPVRSDGDVVARTTAGVLRGLSRRSSCD